jgi:hypothetical protein
MICTVIADLIVLAVNALQVAMRKENVTYPVRSANNRFFSAVNTD